MIHHVGEDSAQQYAFTFPYSPCSPRLKPSYTFEVLNKAGVKLASPTWLSVNDQIPISPQMVIKTNNPKDEGEYDIKIMSTLNTYPTPQAATDAMTLKVFLKVDACYKTTFMEDSAIADMTFVIKDG